MPAKLQVGQWVHVDGRPRRIEDLRLRGVGGRLIHLVGHPRTVVILAQNETIGVYQVFPAPVPRHTAPDPGR